MAVKTELGNGNNTLFWTDKWIHGCSVENLAPLVFAGVPLRVRKRQTVAEALTNNGWVSVIRGGLLDWHQAISVFMGLCSGLRTNRA